MSATQHTFSEADDKQTQVSSHGNATNNAELPPVSNIYPAENTLEILASAAIQSVTSETHDTEKFTSMEGEYDESSNDVANMTEVTAGPAAQTTGEQPAKKQRRKKGDPEPDYSDMMRQQVQKAKRIGQACDRCSLRKMRCDRGPDGCQNCIIRREPCKVTDKLTSQTTIRGSLQRTQMDNDRLQIVNQILRVQNRTLRAENHNLRSQLQHYRSIPTFPNMAVPNDPMVSERPSVFAPSPRAPHWPRLGANPYTMTPHQTRPSYSFTNNFVAVPNQFAPNVPAMPDQYAVPQAPQLPGWAQPPFPREWQPYIQNGMAVPTMTAPTAHTRTTTPITAPVLGYPPTGTMLTPAVTQEQGVTLATSEEDGDKKDNGRQDNGTQTEEDSDDNSQDDN